MGVKLQCVHLQPSAWLRWWTACCPWTMPPCRLRSSQPSSPRALPTAVTRATPCTILMPDLCSMASTSRHV